MLASAPSFTDGTLRSLVISGERAIYLADYDLRGRADLYSIPLAGGAPTRLSVGLPQGAIEQFQVGAAGQIVFSLRGPDDRYSLYSVPSFGGPPVALYAPPAGGAGSRSLRFQVSMAGDRVVYTVDNDTQYADELFSAPTGGGDSIRLSVPLPESHGDGAGYVEDFKLSDDGGLTVYRLASQHLYAVPTTGGASVQLSAGNNAAHAGQGSFAITPDGSRVLYLEQIPGHEALMSVGADGAARAQLDKGTFRSVPFAVMAATGEAIYIVAPPGSDRMLLRRAPIAGGAAVTMSDLGAEGTANSIPLWPSPSGEGLFFTRHDTNAFYHMGLSANQPTAVYPDSWARVFGFTEDGQRAIFRGAAGDSDGLFSYMVAGGAAQRLDDPATTPGGSYLESVLLLPGGDRVIYSKGAQSASAPFHTSRLYGVDARGGLSIELGAGLAADETQAAPLAITADGAVVFATAHHNHPDGKGGRIYRVPADGSGPPALLEASRAIAGAGLSWQVSAADSQAVFRISTGSWNDRAAELRSTPLGGGASVRLNLPVAGGQGGVGVFQVSPGGGRVVYTSVWELPAVDLYSVPILGGAPIRLNGPVGAAQEFVTSFQISPTGSHVIYTVATDGVVEKHLYSVPAGGGPSTWLADIERPSSFTPDGSRVLYVVDDELRSVEVRGGPSVTLGRIVGTRYALSPDSRLVAYESMDMEDLTHLLVSQPVAGGERAVLESWPHSYFEGVSPSCAFTGDSAGVVCSLLAVNPQQYYTRLVHVRAGGDGYTTLATIDKGDMQFQVAPSGGRVLYTVRALEGEAYALFSVPVSGGAAVPLMASSAAIELPAAFDSQGFWAVFRVGADLFAAPTAGGHAVRLNPERPVTSFQMEPAGRVVFTAGGGLYAVNPGGAAIRLNERQALDERLEGVVLAGDVACYGSGYDFAPGAQLQATSALLCADLPAGSPNGGLRLYLPSLRSEGGAAPGAAPPRTHGGLKDATTRAA